MNYSIYCLLNTERLPLGLQNYSYWLTLRYRTPEGRKSIDIVLINNR
jgi:hypothetical protein